MIKYYAHKTKFSDSTKYIEFHSDGTVFFITKTGHRNRDKNDPSSVTPAFVRCNVNLGVWIEISQEEVANFAASFVKEPETKHSKITYEIRLGVDSNSYTICKNTDLPFITNGIQALQKQYPQNNYHLIKLEITTQEQDITPKPPAPVITYKIGDRFRFIGSPNSSYVGTELMIVKVDVDPNRVILVNVAGPSIGQAWQWGSSYSINHYKNISLDEVKNIFADSFASFELIK